MKLTDYEILLVNNGLMLSPFMTRAEARAYIDCHPDFKYRNAAL